MDRVNILDCTLRDGGYVNDFNFGQDILKDIIKKLTKASIDIIECAFLEVLKQLERLLMRRIQI